MVSWLLITNPPTSSNPFFLFFWNWFKLISTCLNQLLFFCVLISYIVKIDSSKCVVGLVTFADLVSFVILVAFAHLFAIDHFTVVCLVAWPLSESEAGVDLVLIKTSLLFVRKFPQISMRTASLT